MAIFVAAHASDIIEAPSTGAASGRHLLEAKPAAPKPAPSKPTKVATDAKPKAPVNTNNGRHLLEAKPVAKPAPAKPAKVATDNKAPKGTATNGQSGRHLLEATRELQQAAQTKAVPAKATGPAKTPKAPATKSTTADTTKKTSTVATGRHLLATQAFKAPGTPNKVSTPKGMDSAGKLVGWGVLLYCQLC